MSAVPCLTLGHCQTVLMAEPLTRDQRWRFEEGVPREEAMIEVILRIYPADPYQQGHPFSGATVDLAYPSALEGRALDRVCALRHGVSTLLDALDGSMRVVPQS